MSNKDHESFESFIFSEENKAALVIFLVAVIFVIWYALHISNMAVACVANGGY